MVHQIEFCIVSSGHRSPLLADELGAQLPTCRLGGCSSQHESRDSLLLIRAYLVRVVV